MLVLSRGGSAAQTNSVPSSFSSDFGQIRRNRKQQALIESKQSLRRLEVAAARILDRVSPPAACLQGNKHGHAMSADREIKMAWLGAPAPPLEDDNILSMILRRLPPLPSSLPRASLVCKRWRRLVTDPHFHRSFLAHHKKAPLLGFFCSDYAGGHFKPALDPPNRVPMPDGYFSSSRRSEHNSVLACHHGRLLILSYSNKHCHLVVWDPITDNRIQIDTPQMLKNSVRKGAVVCASREKDHLHGACHWEPFQVVLIGCDGEGILACVYSSQTCTWGNPISLSLPQQPNITFINDPADSQSSLVGNSVYWAHVYGLRDAVLEFDLHRQTLAIIDAPPVAMMLDAYGGASDHQSFILPADGGGISFIVLSGFSVHVWKRIFNGHGVAGWLFENTVNLGNLLSLKPRVGVTNIQGPIRIVGHDEDGNMIFRLTNSGILYLVHLKTLQFKELSEKVGRLNLAHPFSSFYTAGMHPETGMDGEENM